VREKDGFGSMSSRHGIFIPEGGVSDTPSSQRGRACPGLFPAALCEDNQPFLAPLAFSPKPRRPGTTLSGAVAVPSTLAVRIYLFTSLPSHSHQKKMQKEAGKSMYRADMASKRSNDLGGPPPPLKEGGPRRTRARNATIEGTPPGCKGPTTVHSSPPRM
jgi:hypothetical protein